ncbi:MAG TPA: AI-2E family transporter [Symbiobacteriaceae bacterium]|nr:AI-2E family transporter [Symbiobacteriaceae bacterium]
MIDRRRRIVAALVIGGLVLATGWGLWVIRPILAPFLLAVVVSYLIAPLVGFLAGRGLSRGWAIIAVYAVLALIGGWAIVKGLPQAIAQVQRLNEAIPAYSLRARLLVDDLQQRVRETGLHPELSAVLNRTISDLEVRAAHALGSLLNIQTLTKAAGFVASLLLAPFLSFYMLKDIERFKERFVLSLPRRYRQDFVCLLRGLDGVLAGFVRGQILLSLAVGTLAMLATALLGLRYSLLLGIWAGLTEFIPYVGPLLGAVPAVLAGFSYSPLLGLEVALAFALIQQLENAVLSPRIMGESVGLHPLAVMFAVLAGGYLLGGWGFIVALPLAGLVRVLWAFVVARLTDVDVRYRVAAPAARPERSGEEPNG